MANVLFKPEENYVGELPSPHKDIRYVVTRVDLNDTDVQVNLLRFKLPNPERLVISAIRSQSYTDAINATQKKWQEDYPQFGQLEQDRV
jgi:hypothetical protein